MILLLNGVSAGPVSGPALHHAAQPDGRVLDIAVLILPGAYFRGEHPAAVHPGQVVVCTVRSVDEATSERLVKQVIVIRRDLRMRRGKEIAQGAHASTGWLRQRVLQAMTPSGTVEHVELSEVQRTWLEQSNRKVTVKVGSEQELLAVYEQALQAGLVVHLITDGGLTEFGGVPTRTCLGIGPDYDDRIDPVTGDLELY
jgi:PTH2 family peptidyl-tRNA hydrolase